MKYFKIWLSYTFLDKLKSLLRICLIGPIAIFAVLILRLLNPIWTVKVGYLLSHRIGHFIPNGAEFVHYKNFAKKTRSSIFVTWNDQGISNYFWKKLVNRNAKINGRWLKHIIIWNRRFPGWQRNSYLYGIRENVADPNLMFIQHDLRLAFTERENQEGIAYLESFGWRAGEPFICLQVRDNAYGNKFIQRNEQFEHIFRNSDIKEFLSSINFLEQQGFWILRMGKEVETEIIINNNSKVIDYANCDDKSDFLDIWLFANCTGVISTASGIDSLAYVYRKPTLLVNCLPFNDIPYYSNCIFAPKKIFHSEKEEKRQLNLVDHLGLSIRGDSEYKKNKLTIESLNSSEILECVREFYYHKLGNQPYTVNQNLLQDRAWRTITTSEYFKDNVKAIHPECRIADSLLISLLK